MSSDDGTTASTTSGSSVSSTTLGAPSSAASGGAFPECKGPRGPFAPFCQPANGSNAYIGDSYYVTWDPAAFAMNSTVVVALNYVDNEGGGSQAWQSAKTQNNFGFVSVTMDAAWLNGNPTNNLSFSLIQLDTTADARPNTLPGPTVMLGPKPAKHLAPGPPTPPPNKLGLLVGLPVSLGAVVLMLCGLCVLMRKTRKIGLGNVMGRRKGYGAAKSRRQRTRTARKSGAIRLGEDDGRRTPVVGAGFEDEPTRGVELSSRRGGLPGPALGPARDTSLGSLAGSPTEEDFGDDERAGRSNAFRDEIERQRARRL